MHWIGRKRLSELHRDRALTLAQIGFLSVLLEYVDTSTGHISITATKLAELQKLKRTHTTSYVQALIRHGLLARVRCRKTGQLRYLPHPYLFSVGGAHKRGHLWQEFANAMEKPVEEVLDEARSWVDGPSQDELIEDLDAVDAVHSAVRRRERLDRMKSLRAARREPAEVA